MHEFVEVDLSVAVFVDLLDCLRDLLSGIQVLELITCDELQDLLVVDFAAAVSVKHLESRAQVGLFCEHLGIHSCRQELCSSSKALAMMSSIK